MPLPAQREALLMRSSLTAVHARFNHSRFT
jgi:hypothetical protein